MSHHNITVTYPAWVTAAEDLYFEVEFDYYPASRGAREKGSGVQLEPDEPETWEITEIFMVHPVDAGIKRVDVTEQIPGEVLAYFEEQVQEKIDEPDERY